MNRRAKIFLLDVFILIFILFILTFTASVFFNSKSVNSEILKSTAVITLQIDNVSSADINKIKVLDKIYSSESEEFVGTIKEIRKQQTSISDISTLHGPLYVPPLYQFTITAECNLTYNEKTKKFSVNDKELASNDMLLLRIPDYEFYARILKID